MIILVKAIGIFMTSVGVIVLFAPDFMRGMVSYWRQGNRIYAGGLLRALFGAIFLLSVPQAKSARVIYILGILMLLHSLFIFVQGVQKTKAMLEQWGKRPNSLLRLIAILILAIGALIISSA
jgi:hypothetical protein